MANRITAIFKDKKNSKQREYTFRSTNSISSYLKVSSNDYLNLTTQMTIGTKIEAKFKYNNKTYRPIQTITTSVSTSTSAGISGRSTYTSSVRTTTAYSGRTSSARTTGTGYRRTTRSTSTSTLTNTVSTRTTWYSGTWSSYQSYTLLWTGTNYYSWGGHDTWTDSQIGNEWHANGNASFSRTIVSTSTSKETQNQGTFFGGTYTWGTNSQHCLRTRVTTARTNIYLSYSRSTSRTSSVSRSTSRTTNYSANATKPWYSDFTIGSSTTVRITNYQTSTALNTKMSSTTALTNSRSTTSSSYRTTVSTRSDILSTTLMTKSTSRSSTTYG